MTLSKPQKGLAIGSTKHENANQYSRVFSGDQNLCEQWITYAQTILSQMLLRPGTQSRNVMATPDVSIRVTCRPNRIEINAGGDNCFATYPDILGATGDANNFGYNNRIVHYERYKHINIVDFYAGSNRRIVPVSLSLGGGTTGTPQQFPSVSDFKKGCTVDITNSHVVSWYNNNIYLNSSIFTPFLPSDIHNIVIGASYNGHILALIVVDSVDAYVYQQTDTFYYSRGKTFYNQYRIITYEISFPNKIFTVTEIGSYILDEAALSAERKLGHLKFLDDKKLYAWDMLDIDTNPVDYYYAYIGVIFDFDAQFLVKSKTEIYKDYWTSETAHRCPDVIWSYKGEYIMSFMEGYGFRHAPPWSYRSYHWTEQLLKDNTMIDLGVSFNVETTDTEYTSGDWLFEYQEIFKNIKLGISIYVEYRFIYIQYGPNSVDLWFTDMPTLKINFHGNITSFDSDLLTLPTVFPTALPNQPWANYNRSAHCVYDGKTIVLCFLDYSIIINALSKNTLDYKKLNYRLDGIDCTVPLTGDYFDAEIDVTPLSLTNYYTFPKDKLTY